MGPVEIISREMAFRMFSFWENLSASRNIRYQVQLFCRLSEGQLGADSTSFLRAKRKQTKETRKRLELLKPLSSRRSSNRSREESTAPFYPSSSSFHGGSESTDSYKQSAQSGCKGLGKGKERSGELTSFGNGSPGSRKRTKNDRAICQLV